jgi:hypothetical protein
MACHLGVEGIILIVEMLNLEKGYSRGLGLLGGVVGCDEGSDAIAKEEKTILVTDALQVLELSVVDALKGLEELRVEILNVAQERGKDRLLDVFAGAVLLSSSRGFLLLG